MIFFLVPALVLLAVVLARRGKRAPTASLPGDRVEIGWSPDANWRVAPALARVEARRLLRHPAFVVGVLVTPLMMLAAVESESSAFQASTLLALAMVPLGWMTIVAMNLIVLRSRRSGTEELLVSLPAPYSVRTAGFLLLAPYAFLVAALLLLVGGTVITKAPDVAGLEPFEGNFVPLEAAAGAFIVAGSVGLGVAVARWLRRAAWGVVAMFATVFAQARFLDTDTWPWNSTQSDLRRFLGFLADPTSAGAELEVRRATWHLVYLFGLVVFISVVALARHGWNRRFLGSGFAAALVVLLVAGFVQTRPPSSSQVDTMVARLENPNSEHRCTTHDAVLYCAFGTTPSERVDQWRDRIGAVLAVLPADTARRALEVRQRPPAVVGDSDCLPMHFLDSLPREVVSRVDAERVWPADGHVHPTTAPEQFGCSSEGINAVRSFFVAVQAGAWAVDLPPAPHGDDIQCTADSEARSVLALWLGAQATPGADALLRQTIDEGGDGHHLTFPEWDYPPTWGVTYALGDVLTALDILAKPHDQVVAAVRANWDMLTTPTTPSSAFAELVGVTAHNVDGDTAGDPCV